MSNDSLGDRMKGYENVSRIYLTRRTPVIGRIDGKSFHTLTKGMERPFDKKFTELMYDTARQLVGHLQGCKLAYVQSDEISVLLTDFDDLQTDAWFSNNLQKMASVSAGYASMYFTTGFARAFPERVGAETVFDARFFNLPKEEVANYFIWRQQDASRNSVQMLGQHFFSHKELQGVSAKEIQNKLLTEKDVNWDMLPVPLKRGACAVRDKVVEQFNAFDPKDTIEALAKIRVAKELEAAGRRAWVIDRDIPVFTQNREYIERLIP